MNTITHLMALRKTATLLTELLESLPEGVIQAESHAALLESAQRIHVTLVEASINVKRTQKERDR